MAKPTTTVAPTPQTPPPAPVAPAVPPTSAAQLFLKGGDNDPTAETSSVKPLAAEPAQLRKQRYEAIRQSPLFDWRVIPLYVVLAMIAMFFLIHRAGLFRTRAVAPRHTAKPARTVPRFQVRALTERRDSD
ncbi:hypothetical protein D5S17_01440 [Pseudonocardiaceae bacterium YIM PH 21723]|nr:hypothetical protein D5S17_01440 [Pseudonocardiaceae bacterium YIM PH 21723]